MLLGPHCLAVAGRRGVLGRGFSRLCAVVALSYAMLFRRKSVGSVVRSLWPHHRVRPYLQCRWRRVRAGRTGGVSRRRNSPALPCLADQERRSLGGYFVSMSLNT